MTGDQAEKLDQAVSFLGEGRKEEARTRLMEVLKQNPHNVRAWILLADTVEAPGRRRQILERCLALNPKSELAHKALNALDDRETRPQTSPSADSGRKQNRKTGSPSPWLWLGVAGVSVLLVVAVLIAIFTVAPRLAVPAPTPTLPPPTSTSTTTPTVTPQPSPSPTPTPSELESLETWLPPFEAGTLLSSTCQSLLSMSDAITAEVGTLEYEFEVSLGVGMISAVGSELSHDRLDTWEPPEPLLPYKEKLESQSATLREILDRLRTQDMTLQEIPDALSETCPVIRDTVSQLRSAAEQEGFTEEQMTDALREARAEEPPPTSASTEIGASRANPYPVNAVASTDRWLIQILETVRGEDAWDRIRDLPFAEPPPEGRAYLLVHLHVKNDTVDTAKRGLNRHDFGVTGNRLRRYQADPFVALAPALDVNLPGGWETTGWLTFLVGEDEESLMLMVDPLFGESVRYLALEENASIPMPTRRTLPVPNDLGIEPDAPVPFGETAVTSDWSVALLDAVRGQEAWDFLEGQSIFNQPPPQGQEYLLIQARVRYVSRHESVGQVNGYSFSTTKNPDASPPAVTGLPPSLIARLFPGGEITGWIELLIPEGETARVVFEPPMTLTGDQRRYFALP